MLRDLHILDEVLEMSGPQEQKRIGVKHMLDMKIRPKIRLGEVERLIRKHRILVPPLARNTLIKMCEEGIFETVGNVPTRHGWLVFEDSFWKWARALDGEVVE